ncbi:MAG: transcription elongation factor GreA [Chloroflexi bacterium]|nr:transcription elongation factor GreA [Chloroflexota bacterium]
MAEDKPVFLTEQGRLDLQAELEQLRLVKRPEVAARISQAKEYGDISENSEYEDAKNEQAFTEGRIRTIESLLSRARVLREDARAGAVRLGSRITILDDEGTEEKWMLVSSAEAKASQGKISDDSLVGRALLGKKAGDQVTVQAPKGAIKYKVVSID